MSGPKIVFSILIILILSIGGLLGFYFYINRTSTLKQAPVVQNKSTFSGFDQVTLDNSLNSTSKVDLGSYVATSSTSTVAVATSTQTNTDLADLLRLISPQPVAGFDFITRDISLSSTTSGTSTKITLKNKKTTPTEFIRFILRANGNIFETGTSSTSTTERITNKTISKLQEAFFNNKGDGVIIRNIIGDDAIQTRYLSLSQDGTSTIQSVKSTDLPLNITELSLSPDKTKLFYLKNSGDRGTISNLDGSNKISAFNSPFREWLPQWPSLGTVLLNTKPSAIANGYLYSLDVKTSSIKKILGGISGLTSLESNDGQNLIYGMGGSGVLQLVLYNFKEGSERLLPAGTFPEKCAWGNKYTKIVYCAIPKSISRTNSYPDDWYLGLMHFNDAIWKMNLETGENKLIVDPEKQVKIPLDVINMKLSKNDDYLTFEDKSTLSLWGIKIKQTPILVASSTPTTKKTTKK